MRKIRNFIFGVASSVVALVNLQILLMVLPRLHAIPSLWKSPLISAGFLLNMLYIAIGLLSLGSFIFLWIGAKKLIMQRKDGLRYAGIGFAFLLVNIIFAVLFFKNTPSFWMID